MAPRARARPRPRARPLARSRATPRRSDLPRTGTRRGPSSSSRRRARRARRGGSALWSLDASVDAREERREILVAAAGAAHHDADRAPTRRGELPRDVGDAREGVRGLERGQDPLGARDELHRGERLLVRRGQVRRAPALLQPRMLRPYTRVIEAGADRVRLLDLAALVAEDVALRAVEHADAPGAERRRVLPARDA